MKLCVRSLSLSNDGTVFCPEENRENGFWSGIDRLVNQGKVEKWFLFLSWWTEARVAFSE
jgi:hypothetical protein